MFTKDKYKIDKATRILMLYHQLLNGQTVDKVTYSWEYGVNERTFDRDIEEIRSFLGNIYSDDQLLFDRETSTYYLSGRRPKYLERLDATVITKILLESKLLRRDEMNGLIDTVLSAVAPYDAKVITEYLTLDIRKYLSGTQNAVLKIVGDLYTILRSGYDIAVTVENGVGQADVLDISPLEIVCEDSSFCLIAAQNYSIKNVIKISIDKIVSFKSLQTTFALTLREKYYKTKEE